MLRPDRFGLPLNRPRWIALGFSAGLLALGACHKSDEGPRAAGLAPSAATAPPAAPPPPAMPPAAPAAMPPAAPAAMPATAPVAGGGTITGQITLARDRKGDVSPNEVIYLSARRMPDTPGTRGSLVAVKRFTAASFPIPFTLSEADMMFRNGAFEGLLQLTARADKDGDPMTHKKGDVFGTLDNVKVGSTGVDLKLTELQKQDESLLGSGPMQGGGSPPGLPPGHP